MYAPGRVTDLSVTAVDHAKKQVTLSWTAMGNQLDEGQGVGCTENHKMKINDILCTSERALLAEVVIIT